MIVRRRLSKRAVVKENRLREVCLQQRRLTPNRTLARVTTKSRSEMQTVTNGHVSQGAMNRVLASIPMSETL